MALRKKIEVSEDCRAHAQRLRKLAELATTPRLRKTLMDVAADYDKQARQLMPTGK